MSKTNSSNNALTLLEFLSKQSPIAPNTYRKNNDLSIYPTIIAKNAELCTHGWTTPTRSRHSQIQIIPRRFQKIYPAIPIYVGPKPRLVYFRDHFPCHQRWCLPHVSKITRRPNGWGICLQRRQYRQSTKHRSPAKSSHLFCIPLYHSSRF